MPNSETRKTVLSGIRATGKLHLGNYLGVLIRFAKMSKDPSLNCLFFVADMHTLTTLKEATQIREHLPQIVVDYLAAGIDPELSTIYVQSDVPQVAELAWYLACLTQVGDLERQPTYKDKKEKHPEDVNAGLLTYPILMAADILGPRADLVPVGKDQQAHLELTAGIARRFNRTYGNYFPIPDALREEMLLVPGLSERDDRGNFPKMGKSDGNTINLGDSEEETWNKIRVSPTDPQRKKRSDPGDPERCAIFALHKHVSDDDTLRWSEEGCRTAGIGCMDCKRRLTDNINATLSEFRERRQQLAQNPKMVEEVLASGREKAAARFNETLAVVRDRMGISRRRGA